MGQLDQKVAVVTGAAGSFGRVTAKLLHAEGAKVAMWDVKEEPLVAAARAISTAWWILRATGGARRRSTCRCSVGGLRATWRMWAKKWWWREDDS